MKYSKHLEVENLEELKKMAYITAKRGIKDNFSDEWKTMYLDIYFPSSVAFRYKELIEIYREYLAGAKTKEECKLSMEGIKHRFEKAQKALDDATKFYQAEDEAFKQKGIEFGQVEFTCPNCGGKAWASRQYTPENYAHHITIRGGCEDCKTSHMN